VHAYTNPNRQKKTYSKEDCDFILAIDLKGKNYALIPVDLVPGSGNVRVSERTNFARYFNSLLFGD
jgi:hypothetical protein